MTNLSPAQDTNRDHAEGALASEKNWLTRAAARLGQPLYFNAGYITGITVVGALTGFVFWGLATRLYRPDDIGTASAVLSAVALISGIAEAGVGTGLVRFLPEARSPHRLLNTVFTFNMVIALLVGGLFLAGLSWWSPSLIELQRNSLYAFGFVSYVAAMTLGTVVQMACIARRQAHYAFIQACVANGGRLLLVAVWAGLGVAGLVGSVAVTAALATATSLVLFVPRVDPGYRPRPSVHWLDLVSIVPYSLGTYIASLLVQITQRILPLMILEMLGPASSAHAYMAWMLSTLLVSPGLAMSGSAFAEGSNSPHRLTDILNKAAALSVALTALAALVTGLAAPWILLLFGPTYAQGASGLLRWLALAAPMVVLTNLYFTRLRVQKKIGHLILFSSVVAVTTFGVAAVLMRRLGIAASGLGWLAGNSLTAIIALGSTWKDAARNGRAIRPMPAAGQLHPQDVTAEGRTETLPQSFKLGFFRGDDFSASMGATDWRVGLYLPEFGFQTWIFGTGDAIPLDKKNVKLVRVRVLRLPILVTVQMAVLYAIQAARLELDVVVCNWGLAAAGILCKILRPRTKVVLDVRSMPVENRGLAGFIYDLYFNAACKSKSFDAVSVITSEMLDSFEDKYHFKERVPTAVWASGFDHEIFRPALDGSMARKALGLDDQFVLMFHGSFTPSRGLDQAIRCVRILVDGGMDDLRLVLIGRGAAQPDLSRLVAELDLEEHVKFAPPVPHHKIPELVAAADLGIDPLPDYPWWRDQSPMKVFEYLAMGKPVIATDIPCHRSVSEAVMLAASDAPSALADSIRRFRQLAPQEKSRLQMVASQDVQRQTWRERAHVLADFIRNQVLNER